jgi:recombination protein RecT
MTQTVANATGQRASGPVDVLLAEENKDKFRKVLPASVDLEAFIGTTASALYADPNLMEAAASDIDSLIVAMMKCAALGHMPGTAEYYLTPRFIKGKLRILGIEGYRGVIERMYRSGAVAKVVVREVCAKDKFRYVDGVDDRPAHFFGGGRNDDAATGADFFGKDGFHPRGLMVGVYAYAELITGPVTATSRVVLLNRADVEAARAAGGWKADDKFSPWNKYDAGEAHPEFRGRSMWWKTGAKRLEPWVPTSVEYRREEQRAAAGAAQLGGREQAALIRAARAAVAGDDDVHEAELVPDDAQKAIGGNGGGEMPRAVPVNQSQLTVIGRHMKRLGYTDAEDAERTRVIVTLAGRPDLTEAAKLTRDEAQDVSSALKSCSNRDDVKALLDSGEKPGDGG